MGLRVGTNIAAMASRRSLTNTSIEQSKAFQRLASGNRIISAGDDAAGLSISENLKSQIRSMAQAERNTNDGIALVQVAEGGLNEISNIMTRLRELGIQAASDTVGDRERRFINQEVQSLVQEVDRIANVTTFNGTPLLNGQGKKSELEFQVGIRNDEADRIVFDVGGESDVRAGALGLSSLNYEEIGSARNALETVDEAMGKVSENRARLGAMQNKLQATFRNLQIARENLSSARSNIADADLAEETSNLTKQNILNSAGIAVLSQANSSPMQALKLL